jgi:hypothetical protein
MSRTGGSYGLFQRSPIIYYFIMEDSKEKALAQDTHTLLYQFRYVNNTFVIWPHGTEKFKRDGHLPFLDISTLGNQMTPLTIISTENLPTQTSI